MTRNEKAVVNACMRYWLYAINTERIEVDSEKVAELDTKINKACARLHAERKKAAA